MRVRASNGDVVVDRAHTSVTAKTANGNLRVRDVSQGSIDLHSAAGELEVGIHEGTAAWLDLTSKYGLVRSTLDATDGPAGDDRTVQVRGRTSIGDILVGRASADHPSAS